MELVSIIIPVYNRSNEIRKCYNSIIKQDYQNLEIIFVNDGSTDNTLEILNTFKDKRVKIISKKNGGPNSARIVGLKQATGIYVCFIDSDDTIGNKFISKLVKAIKKDNSNIAISRVGVHYYYPFVKQITLKSKIRPKLINLQKNKEYLPALSPTIIGKLFKKEIIDLKQVKFKANEDIAIMYPLYIKSQYISVVNDAIYHYHLAETSQFKEYLLGYSFKNLINTFEPLKYIYDEVNKMNKLDEYYYEIEMLFIKNISERIWNIYSSVDDKIYQYKFISVLLDYLEYFFPDWNNNIYYKYGFTKGEVSDIFHITKANNIIKKYQRKRLYLSLDDIYNKYKQIENMYNKSIESYKRNSHV